MAEADPAEPRAMPARSQAALLRETASHPLVAHARTLFDASIRRVERRPQPVAAAAAGHPAPAEPAVHDEAAAVHGDE